MKGSEKIAMSAFAFGAAIAFGVYWLFPDLPWWVYMLITVFTAGPAYDQWLKMAANEKIIDRGDWPTKPSPKDQESPQ